MSRAWINNTLWKYCGSTSCRLDYHALCGKWVRAFLYFQRKGGETKAHYLNGLKLALKEVQGQKERSSMHVGREPEIEPTRLGFHNNIIYSAQVIQGAQKWARKTFNLSRLVLQHCCKTSCWLAVLRVLPPTSNLSCNKSGSLQCRRFLRARECFAREETRKDGRKWGESRGLSTYP